MDSRMQLVAVWLAIICGAPIGAVVAVVVFAIVVGVVQLIAKDVWRAWYL